MRTQIYSNVAVRSESGAIELGAKTQINLPRFQSHPGPEPIYSGTALQVLPALSPSTKMKSSPSSGRYRLALAFCLVSCATSLSGAAPDTALRTFDVTAGVARETLPQF